MSSSALASSELKRNFVELYGGGEADIRVFFAPGRVNLIGEHTDYNGGHVFPAPLTFGTYMLARKRDDRELHFASINDPLRGSAHQDELQLVEADGWINYPKAIIFHLKKHGFAFGGYDILYGGNIPGSGLSSSASIHLATAYGLMSCEGHPTDKIQLALIAQEAENQFLHVNCGIMDQFTVAMGRKDHAIMLKCDNLQYEQVPLQMKGYKLLITNTNKRRGLVDSEYNARRSQCEQAVQALKPAFPQLKVLCELNAAQFAGHIGLIADPVVRKRAQHVIEENDRVLDSVKALRANQLDRFGALMNASHISLRDLYEVTCHELDVLAEEAWKLDGVLGSRMTGAGFGGCTVSLVDEQAVEEFIAKVGKAYKAQTAYEADFYIADIGDGVHEEMG